jgi:hypothetical protein
MFGRAGAHANTIANVSFMGKLSIASWGLWVGALGQAGLYGNLLPQLPTWAVYAPLLLPWLTVFTISFCRVAPFGPRPFRNCLLFAICWYAVMTAIAEASFLIIHPATQGQFPVIAARILTYFGVLSFIVLIPAYISLRRLDSNLTPIELKNGQ